LRTGIFFLYIYHKSLIQSKVTFFLDSTAATTCNCCFMYCVIKCVKSTHVLKGKFESSVFHSCKAKNANDENSRHRSAMC
jgi:ubiquitin C-terminal hydrolase